MFQPLFHNETFKFPVSVLVWSIPAVPVFDLCLQETRKSGYVELCLDGLMFSDLAWPDLK